MYRTFLKPLLFLLNPERAHHFTTRLFHISLRLPFGRSIFRSNYCVESPKLERELFGLKFPNPVGLAAGFDKDATLFEDFQHLGFGFIEVGTVTPVGQEGNPKPRMFRLPADHGLINRMGFNNHGVEGAASRLKNHKAKIIIGGNIGKNKLTDNADAASDYTRCLEVLHPHVDYFTVNVSSPNTPGLRELQGEGPITDLLKGLQQRNEELGKPKPILLKIAPDLKNEELDYMAAVVAKSGIAGIVATNTTVSREGLSSDKSVTEQQGGLSGAPVRDRSTEVIRYLHKSSGGAFPIIGVGGIQSPADAIEKLEAGASLVQIYTGLIYEGPALVRDINKALLKHETH